MQILLFECIIMIFFFTFYYHLSNTLHHKTITDMRILREAPQPPYLVKVSTQNQSKLECSTHW